jgi:hypothetical protein
LNAPRKKVETSKKGSTKEASKPRPKTADPAEFGDFHQAKGVQEALTGSQFENFSKQEEVKASVVHQEVWDTFHEVKKSDPEKPPEPQQSAFKDIWSMPNVEQKKSNEAGDSQSLWWENEKIAHESEDPPGDTNIINKLNDIKF